HKEPVFFSSFLKAWIVTRYKDAITILKDHQRFASAAAATGLESMAPNVLKRLDAAPLTPFLLLSLDPPEHTRLRGCLARVLTAQRVASLEPQIRTLANRLIDNCISWRHMDFLEHFASPYLTGVLGNVLNIPEADMKQIEDWLASTTTLMLTAPPAEEQLSHAQPAGKLQQYMHALAQERQRLPQDDFMSD